MRILLFSFLMFLVQINAMANPVREWWLHCKGNDPESTCLSEAELSKFKTICTSKKLKEDCQLVVDYTIAKVRVAEGRTLLLNGYTSQISNFSVHKKYSFDYEKIWDRESFNKMSSFAAGVLPSCAAKSKQKLWFGKNLRSEVKDMRNKFLKIYDSMSSLPCPDNKNGFVLVTIGKVVNAADEFEIFTIDEKKNFKVIHSGLGAGPFLAKKGN